MEGNTSGFKKAPISCILQAYFALTCGALVDIYIYYHLMGVYQICLNHAPWAMHNQVSDLGPSWPSCYSTNLLKEYDTRLC